MPDAHADPMAAFEWLLPALEKDLKESKMWPIRLAQHKHQEKLRFLGLYSYGTISLGTELGDVYIKLLHTFSFQGDLLANHSALIEQKYFELQSYKSLKDWVH